MGKEERTVKEISTKISFKEIVAFFRGLSSNTIEVRDPEIEKSFEESYKECLNLCKGIIKKRKDRNHQSGRNNVPKLGDKVEIKTKEVKGEILRNEEKSIE